MPLSFSIYIDKPTDISKRGWREALRAGWRAVGEVYEEEVKPRKFDPDASERYGYKPRSEKYLRKKRKRAKYSWRVKNGGERLLVYSGVTRTAVMRTHRPRAFPTRVTIDIAAPSYIQMRPRNANRPNMGEELTSMTADEIQQAERVFEATVERALARLREKRKV